MYVRFCAMALMLILFELAEAISERDSGTMDATFRQRSRADWEKVWHQESHTRCREKLLRHLYWACDKDIYRMERRNGATTGQEDDSHAVLKRIYPSVWLDPQVATQMLRSRRSRRRSAGSAAPSSITAECCSRTGCTWEEYAEYCPSNKRLVDI